MEHQNSYDDTWFSIKTIVSYTGFRIVNTKQNATLRLLTKCLYHGECLTCLTFCMTLLAQVTLELRKQTKGLARNFMAVHEKARKKLDRKQRRVSENERH